MAEHYLRCLEYNEAQGATAKGGIGPPIEEADFKTTVRGLLKNSKLAEAIEFDNTCAGATTHGEYVKAMTEVERTTGGGNDEAVSELARQMARLQAGMQAQNKDREHYAQLMMQLQEKTKKEAQEAAINAVSAAMPPPDSKPEWVDQLMQESKTTQAAVAKVDNRISTLSTTVSHLSPPPPIGKIS